MATAADINIHAIPVYDGQSASGLNLVQQGGTRSENFGQALSESSLQYDKDNKKQSVKTADGDNSAAGAAAAAVRETTPDTASNRGEAQRRAINKPAEAASAATESYASHNDRARQDLPVEGNALPKEVVKGMPLNASSGSQQSLQALNITTLQGSALTAQINQPQQAHSLVEQFPAGAAADAVDLGDGLAALLGRQAGLKDGPQADLLRSPMMKRGQTDSKLVSSGAQPSTSAQPVKAIEDPNLRQGVRALSAILAMPVLAEQAGKNPLANSALAAAVVTQDRVADADRRLRLQAAPMGSRLASNALPTEARSSSTALSWQAQDGFADLLAKSTSATGQATPISAPAPTGQGLNPNPGAGVPVLPTLLDSNAMGGAFKLPSGFEISGGTAQGQMVTPFSQPAWAQELAQQAKFMVRDQLQFVELKLKPANLGSVEIVLKQDDDQTTLMFFAKNPAVREALEASLQKLQKSFDEDGLQLEQTFVSDQSLSEHRQQAASEAEQDQANGLKRAAAGADHADIEDQQAKLLIPANDQLLDLWA